MRLLHSESSVKGIRKITQENDTVMKHVINAMSRCLEILSIDADELSHENINPSFESNANEVTNVNEINIRDAFHIFFNFHSRFKGKVAAIDSNKNVKVRHNDGDVEIMTREERMTLKTQVPMPIGDIEIKFIKKCQGHCCNEEVTNILQNEKRACTFNDDEHKKCLRDQLKKIEDFEH